MGGRKSAVATLDCGQPVNSPAAGLYHLFVRLNGSRPESQDGKRRRFGPRLAGNIRPPAIRIPGAQQALCRIARFKAITAETGRSFLTRCRRTHRRHKLQCFIPGDSGLLNGVRILAAVAPRFVPVPLGLPHSCRRLSFRRLRQPHLRRMVLDNLMPSIGARSAR